jgi:hypothetical protein
MNILIVLLISTCGEKILDVKPQITLEQFLTGLKIKQESDLKQLRGDKLALTRIMDAKRKAAK